jgi:Fe-S-cluster formation regulator IscX/YfhJ
MNIEKISYQGWPNCYRLSNELVDLIVTTDVGPRIIRFGFIDEVNEFKEFDDDLGQTGGDRWRVYGGHRLWHAPEELVRTYVPDNVPITLEDHGEFVRLVQPAEPLAAIHKEIEIALLDGEAQATVSHCLRNENLWPVELAPWALSVMAPGGVAIVPQPPRGPHPENLRPANLLTLWAYTDMSDPRWYWGREYVLLRQDSSMSRPQKVGVLVKDGWAAYARDGHLFVKTFDYVPGATYPDFGCNVELFTNADMLEVESLGPLVTLEPGRAREHVERWRLFKGVAEPADDAEVGEHVLPRVRSME